jgi:hypothetical protein
MSTHPYVQATTSHIWTNSKQDGDLIPHMARENTESRGDTKIYVETLAEKNHGRQ